MATNVERRPCWHLCILITLCHRASLTPSRYHCSFLLFPSSLTCLHRASFLPVNSSVWLLEGGRALRPWTPRKQHRKPLKDMVCLVFDGLERYTIFLNSNVPYLRLTVHFSFLVKVSRVVKYFFSAKTWKPFSLRSQNIVQKSYQLKISIIVFITLFIH